MLLILEYFSISAFAAFSLWTVLVIVFFLEIERFALLSRGTAKLQTLAIAVGEKSLINSKAAAECTAVHLTKANQQKNH